MEKINVEAMMMSFRLSLIFSCFLGGAQCTDIKGQTKELTAKYFILATGERPRYPDGTGFKEYCISRLATFEAHSSCNINFIV